MFTFLTKMFPYTGLARIVVLPGILGLNTIIIIVVFILNKHIARRFQVLTWIGLIILSLGLTIASYPQEADSHVVTQTKNAVLAIKDLDNISRLDLKVNGNHSDPRYVVALFKYKDSIPLDGTYNLYEEESSYFYNSQINSLSEIGSKLIGYHKVMWWYLNHIAHI
jgi:hypothetical protein